MQTHARVAIGRSNSSAAVATATTTVTATATAAATATATATASIVVQVPVCHPTILHINSMAAPDKEALFSIFGLDVTATRGEVCKRYKELALKHHPDKNPGSATAKDLMQIYTNARDAILDKIMPEPNGSSFEEFVDEEHKELQGHWQWDASSGQRGAKRKWRDYGDESNVIFEHNAKKGRVEFDIHLPEAGGQQYHISLDPDAPGTGKQVKCDGGLFARRVRVVYGR